MKKSSIILLLATLFFAAVTYYFLNYADAGPDGLGSFVFIILFGVLTACLLIAFLLSFLLKEGQTKSTRNLIIAFVVALPILGILGVTGVFSYFTNQYQNEWENQVESDKSVLQTLRFEDKNFGVAFNHVSGKVSAYQNGTPIPTLITPKVENRRLIVPVDDESYLEPDYLIKIDNIDGIALSKFLEGLNTQLNVDVAFKKGDLDDFPLLPKGIEILMIGDETPYQIREKIGKHFAFEKEYQSDLIYFIKDSNLPENIWILIVSGKVSSAAANVEKMTTDNFGKKNLWYNTLALHK